ncbi:MAG: undecaprenyl-phosphate glucose phosphotransferase [Candidatus Dormiibacterota bacterium]
MAAGDAVCVAAAVLLAYHYRFHFDRIPIPGTEPPSFERYVAAIPVVIVVLVVSLAINRGYTQTRGRAFLDEIYGLIGGVTVGSILLLAMMSLYRDFSYSRLVTVYMAVVAIAILVAFRGLMRVALSQMRRRGLGTTRALVVGSGSGADALIHRLEMFPEYGYELIGVVDDRLEQGSEYNRLPVVGDTQDLNHLIMRHDIEQVFVALAEPDYHKILRMVAGSSDTSAEFKIVPHLLEVITSGVVADDIDGIPLVGVRRSRLVGFNLVIKRVFDRAFTVVLLIPGLPLMGVIAVLIKLESRGPVMYSQERVGRGGHTFTAYKFRSMVKNAEADTGPVFTSRDDPRTTRVGRFLRRTGLDEIPQVFNVLRGDMSLVGPRPERPHFVEQFNEDVPGYAERHAVPPGITGWAQLNDLRQATSIEQRTIYDSYYVDNWSLGFDLKILLATFIRVFFHRNAY